MLRIIPLFAIFLSVSFAQISTTESSLRVLENETRLELAENHFLVFDLFYLFSLISSPPVNPNCVAVEVVVAPLPHPPPPQPTPNPTP